MNVIRKQTETCEATLTKLALRRHRVHTSTAVCILKTVEDTSRMAEQRGHDEKVKSLLPTDLLKDLLYEVRGQAFNSHVSFFTYMVTEAPQAYRQLCYDKIHEDYVRQGDIIFDFTEPCSSVRCLQSGDVGYSLAPPDERNPEFDT